MASHWEKKATQQALKQLALHGGKVGSLFAQELVDQVQTLLDGANVTGERVSALEEIKTISKGLALSAADLS